MPIYAMRCEDWLVVMDEVALPAGDAEILTDVFRVAMPHDGSGRGNLWVDVKVNITLTAGDVAIDVRDYRCPVDDEGNASQDDEPIFTSGDSFVHFAKLIGGAGTYQGSFRRSWQDVGSAMRCGFVQNAQDSGAGTMSVRVRRSRLTEG